MQTRRRDDRLATILFFFFFYRSRVRTQVLDDVLYTCAITDTPRCHALIYLFFFTLILTVIRNTWPYRMIATVIVSLSSREEQKKKH